MCDEQDSLKYAPTSPLRIKTDATWIHWTGGEPLEQLPALMEEITLLSDFNHHLQTSGTIPMPPECFDSFDFVTISPKTRRLQITECDELILVNDPKWVNADICSEFRKQVNADNFYLMPLDRLGVFNWSETADLAKKTGWSITAQIHKIYKIK